MMSRKRNKPYDTSTNTYHSRQNPAGKRRRPNLQEHEDEPVDKPIQKPAPPPAVVVMGLAPGCSVLDLKSRFEIYGSISRIRIDRDGVGCVAFRAKDSADAAIAASLDPSFGITLHSQKVQVLWATDPAAKWREGVELGSIKASSPPSSSKLLRAEVPLRRHGRGNKLASAIVNPRGGEVIPQRAREIVAYDDIL